VDESPWEDEAPASPYVDGAAWRILYILPDTLHLSEHEQAEEAQRRRQAMLAERGRERRREQRRGRSSR
jgi:hypothetical protein